MSVLSQFRWNTDRAVIVRAALRGVASSINFSLIALATSHLRSLRFGKAVEEVDSHFGHNVDQRNEIDLEIEGNQIEAQLREDQGFAIQLPPLELAAMLKVIRDSCDAELDAHASLRMNPLTRQRYKYPFDIVAPLSESLVFMLSREAQISEAMVQNTMKVLGADEQSIRLVLQQDHERQRKYLKDNAHEILSIIDSLEAKGQDGHVLGIQDDETVEERLPALNRARLYVAADNGLVSRRLVDFRAFMRGNPDALGNIGMIDGERKILRLKFVNFMKAPEIKDEIADAVSRGAKAPQLQALFPDVPGTQQQKAA